MQPSMQIVPPNLLGHLELALPIARKPRFGLILDFDGTISEIAPTPGQAEIEPGCAEALDTLSRRLALTAVVSGRAVVELRDKVGLQRVRYVGSHGAEYLYGREVSTVREADAYRDKIMAVFERLKATVDQPGFIWQDKGVGASVLYRLASNPDEAERALREAVSSMPDAQEIGVFWGKRVLELRALIGMNKGYALRKLVDEFALDGAIYIGDDTTDADALSALNGLVTSGDLTGLGVAITYRDSPEELLAAAQYSLAGVGEVETFLRWLNRVCG